MQYGPAFHDLPFLKVIQPESRAEATMESLYSWLGTQRPLKALDQDGGLLIRGFPIDTPSLFAEVLEKADFRRTRYIAGNNPRNAVMENVYLSTTYPPEWSISLHSEMSHLESYPRYISLYCKTPAQTGTGLTPLARNADVLLEMEKQAPQLMTKLRMHGVSYIQRMKKQGTTFGFGRPWQEVFETSSEEAVEKFCESHRIPYRWEGDELVVTHTRGPTATHPVTKDEMWFNQGEQWHHTSLSIEVQKFLSSKIGLDKVPHHARFGNGDEFTTEELAQIRRVYDQCSRRFQWMAGDVLIIDNIRLAHGRDTYLGAREVFFAMGIS